MRKIFFRAFSPFSSLFFSGFFFVVWLNTHNLMCTVSVVCKYMYIFFFVYIKRIDFSFNSASFTAAPHATVADVFAHTFHHCSCEYCFQWGYLFWYVEYNCQNRSFDNINTRTITYDFFPITDDSHVWWNLSITFTASSYILKIFFYYLKKCVIWRKKKLHFSFECILNFFPNVIKKTSHTCCGSHYESEIKSLHMTTVVDRNKKMRLNFEMENKNKNK